MRVAKYLTHLRHAIASRCPVCRTMREIKISEIVLLSHLDFSQAYMCPFVPLFKHPNHSHFVFVKFYDFFFLGALDEVKFYD